VNDERYKTLGRYLGWGVLALLIGVAVPATLVGAGKFVSIVLEDSMQVAAVSSSKSKKKVDPYPYVPETASGDSRLLTQRVLKTIHEGLPRKATLSVQGDAFAVIDLQSGEVIVEKNPTKVLSIASLTKMVTALVALDVYKPDQVLKVPEYATKVTGTVGGLKTGEKVRVVDLLHALLMQSGNDAAETLAAGIGRSTFVTKMNEKVRFLGADATTFVDPTGLSALNVSTANDLFKIAQHTFNDHREIINITKTKMYRTKGHTWVNPTKFLALDNYLGGKTGYTSEAGRTAVSIFEIEPSPLHRRTLAIVLLKSEAREKDVLAILEYLKKDSRLLSRVGGNLGSTSF